MDDQLTAAIRKAVAIALDRGMRPPDIFTTIRQAIEAELASPTISRPAAPKPGRWYPPVTR